jgi:hypothetical protein
MARISHASAAAACFPTRSTSAIIAMNCGRATRPMIDWLASIPAESSALPVSNASTWANAHPRTHQFQTRSIARSGARVIPILEQVAHVVAHKLRRDLHSRAFRKFRTCTGGDVHRYDL